MSKITGLWKWHLRPTFLNTVRRFGGVPVPHGSTTAVAYAAESPACRLTAFPSPTTESIPPRTVVGSREAIEATQAMIPDPEVRAAYERLLAGASLRQSDAFVALIDDGRVCHDTAIPVTADDRVLADAVPMHIVSTLATCPLRLRYLPRPRRRTGCMALLSCAIPYNYYHWLIEALPRLALYDRAGIAADRFYAPMRYRFQRESLQLAGIAPGQIERATPNSHVVADRVAASSVSLMNSARWKTDFLYRRFTRSLDAAVAPSLRVFVSRRRRGKRTVVNDNDVFRALQPLGFRRYDLETMTFAEQVRLFFNAACVVGPHGAGLSNIVFCRPGTKVVEVNTPYRTITCFYDLAHFRQLDYRLHVAQPICDRFFHFDPQSGSGDSDMWVDPLPFARSMADFLDAAPAEPARTAA
jgi:capsular polysaccharide biosynthesis protein